MQKKTSYIAVFPRGSKISAKNFRDAFESGDTKRDIQNYLNKLLEPTNRIALEEVAYAMMKSRGGTTERLYADVKLTVNILNTFLLSVPSQRFKRIQSSLDGLGVDCPSDFVEDFMALISFFDNLAMRIYDYP